MINMTKKEIFLHARKLGYDAKYSGRKRRWYFSKIKNVKSVPGYIHKVITSKGLAKTK